MIFFLLICFLISANSLIIRENHLENNNLNFNYLTPVCNFSVNFEFHYFFSTNGFGVYNWSFTGNYENYIGCVNTCNSVQDVGFKFCFENTNLNCGLDPEYRKNVQIILLYDKYSCGTINYIDKEFSIDSICLDNWNITFNNLTINITPNQHEICHFNGIGFFNNNPSRTPNFDNQIVQNEFGLQYLYGHQTINSMKVKNYTITISDSLYKTNTTLNDFELLIDYDLIYTPPPTSGPSQVQPPIEEPPISPTHQSPFIPSSSSVDVPTNISTTNQSNNKIIKIFLILVYLIIKLNHLI